MNKLKSLLRFYNKNKTEIELKVLIKEGMVVKGSIISMSPFFNEHIVLKSTNESKMKIFLEDIDGEYGIIPTDFIKNKKEKEIKDVIPPKLRWEVFRRDKFVCQYCGACGPNVELEVDHKIPVSRGGTDNIDNLKTACFNCNRGKGNRV